ncbi:MAG: hypothetical protein ACRD2Z_06480 [Thermoanaerobaculia bacterium]
MMDRPLDLKPLPFTVLLDEGVRLFRRHFRRTYLPVALPMALGQLIYWILYAIWMKRMFGLGTAGEVSEPTMWAFLGAGFGVGCVGTVLILALHFFSYSALGKLAIDAVVTGEPAARTAWRFAFRLPVIGTQLLTWLLVGLSVLACCVGWIYAVPALSMVLPVMSEERRFGGAALSRSHELARYNPERRFFGVPMVRILILLVVALVLSWALTFAFQLPVTIVQQWQLARAAVEGGEEMVMPTVALWLYVPAGVLGSLAQTAVQLYAFLGVSLLFVDTRKRKEAPDLESALSALESAMAPDAPEGV